MTTGIEVPRLTGMLRTFAGEQKGFDMEKEFIVQSETLKKRLQSATWQQEVEPSLMMDREFGANWSANFDFEVLLEEDVEDKDSKMVFLFADEEETKTTASGAGWGGATGNRGTSAPRERDTQQRPAFGNQFSIKTQEEKYMEKLRRKEDKRKKGGKDMSTQDEKIFDNEYLREERERSLQKVSPLEGLRPASNSSTSSQFGLSTNKIALPEGTKRIDTKDYQEVLIPVVERKEEIKEEDLIPITALDDFAQLAFKGIKRLNRIQSRVFEIAYNTNENMLICAPTGAGKTNIALLTVLHEVKNFMRGGAVRKDEFKIVYVAPMKALAAEMVSNFGRRLEPLGLVVRELTGDMQLTKRELTETQMIVTTPEKWDVVTRKSSDVALTQLVKLIIIDEVHLLNEDRGPVIESIIARTLRQVESSQSMIRIVGLSATLPNYADVAQFLHVNPNSGLFFFDASYRPVPLSQQYIGVKETDPNASRQMYNDIAYKKVKQSVLDGYQAMVFVHSRNDTAKTAIALADLADEENMIGFLPDEDLPKYHWAEKEVNQSRNKHIRELWPRGFAVHHAGMLRSDRSLVERLFMEGLVKVLVCTATLAWGVNLPAHTVVIKGTQLYDPKKGTMVELGMLDVMQIFGRAGRPQFDTSGEGIIITSIEKLPYYLSLMNHQLPIESQMINNLPNNLNAEVVLGTVTNVSEAVTWLSYTYLYIRMLKNPLVYGLTYQDKEVDPFFDQKRKELITMAAKKLDECQMIRFDENSGNLGPTELGRVASHYYILHDTIRLFNEKLSVAMDYPEILELVSCAHEFENIKLRDEEFKDLERLLKEFCKVKVKGGVENPHGKVNILLQTYISQGNIEEFSLVTDTNYIVQSAGRLIRALFEIVLKKGWTTLACKLLTLTKEVDRRLWDNIHHPLRQFPTLSPQILTRLEQKKATIEKLLEMNTDEIGAIINFPKMGKVVLKYINYIPNLDLEVNVQPITRTVLRVQLTITPTFKWSDRIHGSVEPFWIWIEDMENEKIYHTEYFLLSKKQIHESQKLCFTIPISADPLPSQHYIHAVSDRWLGAETVVPMSFQHLILPEQYAPHTELLDLQPLPATCLHNPNYEKLYNFSHFNPIQTQVFHTMMYTNKNVLIGAPTGSGKTICAELAMFNVFNNTPNLKVVYIAPLKALVRERIKDWNKKFVQKLGKKMVELTGDYTPDIRALQAADIVTTTPEKWDGISRNWQQRSYVKSVGLIIIDEIHLLGEERGPILEVIVSRMRYISSQTENPIRIIGLSTAVANAKDLADWLGIEIGGLFNFRPSVRPVPLEVHIQGYAGKHYCPRMATMNKPAYASIMTYSPYKSVLIFVSSRRQTRLTALDLISFCAANNPHQFLHMTDDELKESLRSAKDPNLRHTLEFGIGLHHAGLMEDDRVLVENLFGSNKIQILISTSTLAWGVNLPAHLVIVKGTEYFDPKTKRYVDYPITDVLQMIGRAGRPQYDNQGKAVILVEESKKNFYKKFLYDPFPVESCLLDHLHNHINAEIVSGTISSKQDAIDYLTWTYFFRRLMMNPNYYGLDDSGLGALNKYLSGKVDDVISDLESARCVEVGDDGVQLTALTLGRIASYYYLNYTTVKLFHYALEPDNDLPSLLSVLCNASEYDELPVRHNEDKINSDLAAEVPWPVDASSFDDPHTKAHLLLQAHFTHMELPISDYETDTKSVLEQSIRILQAMVDVSADRGYLFSCLRVMHLMQMIVQARWSTDSTLTALPYIEHSLASTLSSKGVSSLPELMEMPRDRVTSLLKPHLPEKNIKEIVRVLNTLPLLNISFTIAEKEIYPGEEVNLQITITRENKPSHVVHAPNFPKRIEREQWWMVVGDAEDAENSGAGNLIAMRRVSLQSKSTSSSLSWLAPSKPGRYHFWLYLVSDCYIGIDRQMLIDFEVLRP